MFAGHPGFWAFTLLVGGGIAFWGRCMYVNSASRNSRRVMMIGLGVIAFALFLTPFPNDPFAMPTKLAFGLAVGIIFLCNGILRYLEGPNA